MLILEKLIDKIITEICSVLMKELHLTKMLFTLIKVLLMELHKKLKTMHLMEVLPVVEQNTTKADMELTTLE